MDLLLVCDLSEKTDIEFQLRIRLAVEFPEWKGLEYDIKHVPLGQIRPELPIEVLILAELKEKNPQPIMGEHVLHQTIDIPRDLLLRAQLAILYYWANIFLNVDMQKVFFIIQSQKTLRSFYGCVQAYFTYLLLYQNQQLVFIDQEKIPDVQFQKFRNLVQTKLQYSFDRLDTKQMTEIYREVQLMHSFCAKIWENLNHQKVRRIA